MAGSRIPGPTCGSRAETLARLPASVMKAKPPKLRAANCAPLSA